MNAVAAPRAVIYARVSTEGQAEKGFSLPEQLEACRAFAAERGYQVIGEFQDAESGTKAEREGLDQVFALAEQGAFEKLLIKRLDRLSRGGMVQYVTMKSRFERRGVQVEYIDQKFDDSPMGRFGEGLMVLVAQLQREVILDSTKDGKTGRAKAHKVNPGGGMAPYGYRYEADTYVPDPEERKIIEQIYHWYAVDKLGTKEIATRLSGVPTRCDSVQIERKKMGRGQWSNSLIGKILRNELYAGVAHYGKRITVDTPTGEKRQVKRDKGDWIAVPVEPIVSRELWEAAQRQAEANRTHSKRNTQGEYLIAGRLRCARCGRLLSVKFDSRRPHLPPRYRCSADLRPPHATKDIHCGNSISQELIDRRIWEEMHFALTHRKVLTDSVLRQLQRQIKGMLDISEQIAAADLSIAKLQAKKERWQEQYADGELTKENLKAQLAPINSAIRTFEAQKRAFEKQTASLDEIALWIINEGVSWETINEVSEEVVEKWVEKAVEKLIMTVGRNLKEMTFSSRRELIEMFDITVFIDWQTRELRLDGDIRTVLSIDVPDGAEKTVYFVPVPDIDASAETALLRNYSLRRETSKRAAIPFHLTISIDRQKCPA